MASPEQSPAYEMASVLFIDIVGYSLGSIDEQSDRLTALQQAVLDSAEYKAALARRELISLPAGDGIALVFFGNPMSPVKCALEIAASLRSHPAVKVRMGLNTGPVRRHADIKEEINVVGGGINIAQRVMDCGDAGHILLSENIAEVVQQARGWRECLTDLGTYEVKHGVKVHVYGLCKDGSGNPASPHKMSSRTKERRQRLAWIATAALLLATAAAGSIWLTKPENPQSIAVLPFEDMSPEKNQQYLSDGLAEALYGELVSISGLHVAAVNSTLQLRGNSDFHSIGRTLNVAKILTGSVSRQENRLRIRVQLVKAQNGEQLWADKFDRDMSDIFAVQDEIARAVRHVFQIRISERMTSKTNSEAYNAYLQGRYLQERETEQNLEQAVGYYKQAIALDPAFARAWVGLSNARSNQAGNGYCPLQQGYHDAEQAAEHALALDPNLASAHGALGYVKMSYAWDWNAARESFSKELALEPENAFALEHLAYLDLILHRFDEGIERYRQAIDRDPLNPAANRDFGMLLHYAGRQMEAEQRVKKALELMPKFGNAYNLLTRVYLAESRPQDALVAAGKETYEPFRLYALALAYHGLGRQQEADEYLAKLVDIAKNDGPFQIAEVYAFRGEKDQAFHWLDNAFEVRDGGMLFISGDPLLKNLEKDARLAAMLTKLHLTQ